MPLQVTESAESVSREAPSPIQRGWRAERSGRRRLFFVAMATILVAIVAVGFAASFYLRWYFAPQSSPPLEALPGYLSLHGVVLTSWFLLFFGQTVLIASGRTRLHRSMGVAGAIVALAVVAMSLLVVVRSVARSANGPDAERQPVIVIGNIGTLLLFALFVAGGIRWRRQPEVHKRLMLLASISIVAPAISRWPGALAFFPFSVLVPHLSLFAAVIGYDLISTGRLHRATAWGVSLYVAVAATSIALGLSPLGRTLVNTLK